MTQNITLINADVIDGLKSIDKNSIDTIITSPPYWSLRDYGSDGQIGMEPTLIEYHDRLLEVTAQLKRIMKPSGVLLWNHGDSYDEKCLTMQNERLIIRMIDEQGFILRNKIIWYKNNGMPSSVTDRFSNKYEPIYMLVKSKKYWFDLDAVRVSHKTNAADKLRNKSTEPYNQSYTGGHFSPGERPEGHTHGKNPGDVWEIPTQPHKDAHFAIFPDVLVEPLVKAGCPTKVCPECGFIQERIVDKTPFGGNSDRPKTTIHAVRGSPAGYLQTTTTGYTSCECDAGWNPGIVLDPFAGSGTTMKVAKELGRSAIGIELSEEYCEIIKRNLLFHQYTLGNIVNKFVKL